MGESPSPLCAHCGAPTSSWSGPHPCCQGCRVLCDPIPFRGSLLALHARAIEARELAERELEAYREAESDERESALRAWLAASERARAALRFLAAALESAAWGPQPDGTRVARHSGWPHSSRYTSVLIAPGKGGELYRVEDGAAAAMARRTGYSRRAAIEAFLYERDPALATIAEARVERETERASRREAHARYLAARRAIASRLALGEKAQPWPDAAGSPGWYGSKHLPGSAGVYYSPGQCGGVYAIPSGVVVSARGTDRLVEAIRRDPAFQVEREDRERERLARLAPAPIAEGWIELRARRVKVARRRRDSRAA